MPATLAQLEARVAALEAGATGAETNSPNYLTLSPAGAVGALFSGGVQLIETPTTGYVPGASIAWLDDVDQVTMREFIKGRDWGGGQHGLVLKCQPDPGSVADMVEIDLASSIGGAHGSSQASVALSDSADGVVAAVILDSLGRSNFLQLPSTKQLAVDCGTALLPFPNGSTTATPTNISHALGRTPVAVIATGASAYGTQVLSYYVSVVTASVFTLGGSSTGAPNAPAGFPVFWIALG